MFDDLMTAYGSRFFIAAGGVGIGLLLLFVILWLMRNRAPSPFVRGGRNRQPRLQVLDAAAVDARRRLVLVRRDDVEHLIMIGGPTDIVIESRIGQQLEAAPAPAQTPALPQPVMIADAGPAVVAATPSIAIARSLAAIEPPAPAAAPEPAPIDVRPEPPARAVAPQPLPVAAERERAPRPAPPEPSAAPPLQADQQPQSFRVPDLAPNPAPIEAAMAADILDSARQRVLQQQRVEPPLIAAPPAPSHQSAAQPAAVAFQGGSTTPLAPPVQPSDFQRILEEEMTSTLAADRMAPMHAQPNRPVPAPAQGNPPRRDPEMAPITGADAALQNEVARIFGEMSVNRDK